MFVWRLTRQIHAENPLTGEGARRFGGRWNHVGTPVVYASATLSLAVLEYLVNLPISDLPEDLVSIQIAISDDVRRSEISVKVLPDDWRVFPATEELKDIGTEWVSKGKTAVLTVPSVVIPNEANFVINPAHPEIRRVKIESVAPFALDARLRPARRPARKGDRRIRR